MIVFKGLTFIQTKIIPKIELHYMGMETMQWHYEPFCIDELLEQPNSLRPTSPYDAFHVAQPRTGRYHQLPIYTFEVWQSMGKILVIV